MHKRRDDRNVRIGIFSYQQGTGVTHLTLTFGAYYSSRMGKKVWIWEIGNQHTLENLEEYLKIRHRSEGGVFQGDRITFFPNLSVEKALNLLKDAPEVLLIDFGQMSTEKEILLNFCTQRLLVCDFSPWKQEDIMRTLLWKKEEKKTLWNRLLCYLGRSQIVRVKRCLGEKVEVVPEIGNPFLIRRQDVKLIKNLCQD